MQVRSGVLNKTTEEVFCEFRLKVSNEANFNFVFVNEGGAAAKIDGNYCERFVHREHEVSGAVDALAIAERLRKKLAKDNSGVFDSVVLVDVEVAFGRESQIEAAMLGEELQHMVEETYAG
jgi:hypothetical protein